MTVRYSNIILNVEIVAGTSDTQAAVEMTMLATDVGTIVEAKQRGVTMRAFPGGSWEEALRQFERDERLSLYPTS